MTNRLFAYNPTGDPIDGCETYGTLAVSVTEQAYCNDIGGIKWWGGPDEDLGYIVAKVIPPNDQPTEVPGLTGDVAFNRSTIKTEASFLDMVRIAFGQTFGSGDDAKTWLNNNNHWTNWGLSSPTPTPAATSTPTSTPTPTPAGSNYWVIRNCQLGVGYEFTVSFNSTPNVSIGQVYKLSLDNYAPPYGNDNCWEVISSYSGSEPYYHVTTINSGPFNTCNDCNVGVTPTPTPAATSTPTPTPSLFTGTVDYAVNAYNACWNKIGSINVTGDGTTFCNSSNYTAAAFASLSTGNYVLSYLGNTVNISVTFGSPNAVMYGGGCQTCPAQ